VASKTIRITTAEALVRYLHRATRRLSNAHKRSPTSWRLRRLWSRKRDEPRHSLQTHRRRLSRVAWPSAAEAWGWRPAAFAKA